MDPQTKSQEDLIRLYNYDEFVPGKYNLWMRWEESPPLGTAAPDFPLWDLNGGETRLSAVWTAGAYTVVEFGSFT
jgi:hypothetical protein